MASSSLSSLSYDDSFDPTQLPNDFNFGYSHATKSQAFHQPYSLPLEENPIFYSTEWPEIPPQSENLYLIPPTWESPEPLGDYQLPPKVPTWNSLADARQEKLQEVPMPRNIQYNNRRSPQSSSSCNSNLLNSPDNHERTRKRKSFAEVEDEDEDSNPIIKKIAHNMIEKRYRTNLNDKIAALRDSVPSLRIMSKSARGEDTVDDREELQGLTPAHKLNKATVLSKATEYIGHLEKRNKRLQQENLDHRAQLAAYEALFRSNFINFNATPNIHNPFQSSSEYSSPVITPDGKNTVLIQETKGSQILNRPNPQSIYPNAPQGVYLQTQKPQVKSDGWNGHPYAGKLMMGTMAGLMIMEGINEAEQISESPNGRGLSALPINILEFFNLLIKFPHDINILGCHASTRQILWYLKFLLIFSSVIYIFLPEISFSRSNSNRGKFQSCSLTAAPSLASPIQVRREAWLTAIQTVWVPRHNILLEAAALCLKIAKLSIRNLLGWHTYTILTGITEQQEIARIKAWSIGLDAQLAGGDIEVNASRLTLTLLASATLPDTTARLMLAALHIRVLLWEVGNGGSYLNHLIRRLASKLARWKWKKAMELQELNAYQNSEIDSLPNYLIVLLQQSSDDVLNDSICQRAYNLARNLSTTNNTCIATNYMDAIVDDFAIRSPLDAVAAWYSSFVLQRALFNSLEIKDDNSLGQKMIANDVDLAIRMAPIGSGPHIRALVARSILVKEKREASIAEAMEAIGPLNKHIVQNPPPNIFDTYWSKARMPEVELCLRCAMAIVHIERCPMPILPRKAIQMIKGIFSRNKTLLGFIASFKLMEQINSHEKMAAICINSLERLAGSLRIWIGGNDGEKIGLPVKVKKEKIERCLSIAKRIVVMQDSGYASMSDPDDIVEENNLNFLSPAK
ncbi:Sterol regulatory element-binding protein 1 [Golovinomyces cichoracearum]|uniref:Sterol regulatory element-binding protein 1 n=1 Tax=Golovinomyces cichoracearum TaxID=62708 RepID=A0A420IK32_9PEZI|nr:Sterol regulatory element-binding protein 1 [Golovinomyces cichoracearum]